jgi:hypothetical protein
MTTICTGSEPAVAALVRSTGAAAGVAVVWAVVGWVVPEDCAATGRAGTSASKSKRTEVMKTFRLVMR